MVENNFQTKWNLNRYYKNLDDKQIEEDKKQIEKFVEKFITKYKGKIKDLSAKDFLEYFKDEEQYNFLFNKIGLYYIYISSIDTQNQIVIRKETEFEKFSTRFSNKLLFVSQEFKEIGFDKLMKFSNDNLLKDYKNYFVQKANNIKYILDEKTEFALNLKENSGASALCNLYEELTNSFMFKVNIDGVEKEITDAQVRTLRLSSNEKVRKESYRALRKVYNDKKIQITLGNIYSGIVNDSVSEIKIRGFKNVMSQRNISEELEDVSVNLLLEEVEKSYPIFQRFLKIKAKLLGKEKLKIWDLLAPISKEEKEIKFEEGVDIFLKVIKEFDEEFYDYSKNMFEDGRVDIFPNSGKMGGAFAQYTKNFDSFVLLNYTNKLQDVSTLAHELGHAIHGHLAQIQNSKVFSSGLSLAETASIFNEMILSEKLMEKLNTKEKLVFLEKKLTDIFSTIFRQIQYILFEKKIHQLILDEKGLTYQDYNKLWREEMVKLHGEIVEYDVEAKDESSWSMIPHIFRTPFYCYAYAFGNILTFALYNKYKQEGRPFVDKYKNILRAGGSKTPYDLLKENGFDIKSRKFFQDGIKVVEDMVYEFEKLSGDRYSKRI